MSASSKSGPGSESSAWELFNVDSDFSQANDLAAENPEKLRALQDLWWVEAAKYDREWLGQRRLVRDKVTVELKAK